MEKQEEGLRVDVGVHGAAHLQSLLCVSGVLQVIIWRPGVRCCVNVSLCHENLGNSTYSFPRHPPADIAFRALFTDTRARLCSAVALCLLLLLLFLFYFFFAVLVPRARCSCTTPLGYYCRERRRGMCLGSVGSGLDPRQPHRWLESQSLFLSPSISFSSAPFCLPTILHAPPPPPTLCR